MIATVCELSPSEVLLKMYRKKYERNKQAKIYINEEKSKP